MMLTSVLLPAPFSPRSAWISPGRTESATSLFARQPGNRLTMPLSWSRGAPAALPSFIPCGAPARLMLLSPPSVGNLVGLRQPFLEHQTSFLGAEPDERHRAVVDCGLEFSVDAGIVEADRRRIGTRVGVVDAVQPRPIDGTEAHRARLAARIDLATG